MSSKESRSRRQVIDLVLSCIQRQDINAFADLFRSDGVMEHPTQAPGPTRRMEGREEIRRCLTPVWGRWRPAGIEISSFDGLRLYESDDGEGIVADFISVVKLPSLDLQLPHLFLIRVHDGQIVLLRDYYDVEGHRQLVAPAFASKTPDSTQHPASVDTE